MASKSISDFSPKCPFHISNSASNNYTWVFQQHLWPLSLWTPSHSPSHFTLIITTPVQMFLAFFLGPLKGSLVASILTLNYSLSILLSNAFSKRATLTMLLLFKKPQYLSLLQSKAQAHCCGIRAPFCDKVNQFKQTHTPHIHFHGPPLCSFHSSWNELLKVPYTFRYTLIFVFSLAWIPFSPSLPFLNPTPTYKI